jgi:glycosyltransferase involved in cell wall biosynthesis
VKIAIDGRELAGAPTGVGRYLSELMAHWVQSKDARRHEWHLYGHTHVETPDGFLTRQTVLPGDAGTAWEQWTLARALTRDRPDVLFAPGYSAPLTAPCPITVTIHDVSFAAHPEWFSFRERTRRWLLTGWSARRARIVLTDSAFSRDEIARRFAIPRNKVRVIPLGISHRTAGGSPNRSALVLFVGSIFRRRHVDWLVTAFAESVAARVPESRLEIVGENRSYPPLALDELVRSYPREIARRISLRSYVDEETLRQLYASARVFAFPSEYEGFGLTPLEALAAGVPPIVMDTAVAREVYGSAARYVPADVSNIEPLANAIVELMTSAEAREEILRHAVAVLGRYDWHRTAVATLGAIEEAAGAS